MSRSAAKLSHTPEEDFSKNTLLRIESTFGRLAYLVSLRDLDSGTYRHDGLAVIYGEAKAVRAVKRAHETTFADWLKLSLAQKKADLDVYFGGAAGREPQSLKGFTQLTAASAYIPQGAGQAETALFLTEMRILVEVLGL